MRGHFEMVSSWGFMKLEMVTNVTSFSCLKNSYTSAPPKVEWGYTGFTPMPVRPSVCRQGFRNCFKKLLARFIPYPAFTLMVWISWPLFIFVFLALFWSSGGQIFDRKWGFRNFLKKLLAQFISYLAFILMGWVSWPLYISVFLALFSALWWPNIWLKMGFPEFKKDINLYSIFLDEVGIDQSGGILSPLMGTACF